MRLVATLGVSLLAAAATAAPDIARAPCPGAPNVRVMGDVKFQDQAAALLARLDETAVGRLMLSRLARTKRSVAIRPGRLERSGALMMPLAGGDAVILLDPAFARADLPPLVVLHHECLHALHWAADGGAEAAAEEERAIGIGLYASSDVSENALRRELGLPPRSEHH